MIRKDCNNCIKRKTMFCPNSQECFTTIEKPYYLDNTGALKEIKRLNNKINSIFGNFEQFINSYKNDKLDDFFIVLRLSEVVEFYSDLKEVIHNEC